MGRGLRRQAVPERIAALEFERDRLLKKIALKKRDIAALEHRMEEATRVLAGTQSVRDEALALDSELHRLFAELLARKRQPKHVRRTVAFVYDMLRESGLLSPHGFEEEPEDDDDGFPGAGEGNPFASGPGGPRHAGGNHHPPPGGGGFSARRPSDAVEDQSLRGVFRRLAMAIHPDRVPDEGEKIRRTELMKEISRAYQDRDLARLLHLERTWAQEGVSEVAPAGDELDRKRTGLERTIAGLRTQLGDLGRALRELRRSPAAELVKDLRRSASGRGPDPIAALIAQANAEVAEAREIRDFVASYRDGKITVDELALGPVSMRKRASRGRKKVDPERDFDDPAVADFLAQLFGGASEIPTRARRAGRRGSRSGRRPGDVPF